MSNWFAGRRLCNLQSLGRNITCHFGLKQVKVNKILGVLHHNLSTHTLKRLQSNGICGKYALNLM